MKTPSFWSGLMALSTLHSAEGLGNSPKSHKLSYYASIAVVVAAHALDLHSSMGGYETNPLLRDSTGRFSPARGVMIKASLLSAALGSQVLIRKLLHGQQDKSL